MQRVALVLAVAMTLLAAPPKPAPIVRVPVWLDEPAPSPRFEVTSETGSSRVLGFKGPTDNLMILTVLDLSDEIEYAAEAKQALASEFQKLPSSVWIGLLRAQDGLRVLVDPTPDRTLINTTIEGITIGSKAGLLEALDPVEQIADSILKKTAVRVAVLYITDSDVHNYREDFTNPVINSSDTHDLSRRFPEALIQEKIAGMSTRLAERQAPVFIVHLRYRTDRLNDAYQSGLKQVSEVLGGSASFCRSSAEIPDAIHRSIEVILQHYSLTVELPHTSPRNVRLQVRADGAEVVTYRNRFSLTGR